MRQLKLKGLDLSNVKLLTKENMKAVLGGTSKLLICSGPCRTNTDCPTQCLCSPVTFTCINRN